MVLCQDGHGTEAVAKARGQGKRRSVSSVGRHRTHAHQLFDEGSASRAGSFASSRKKTSMEACVAMTSHGETSLAAPWLGQRVLFKKLGMPPVCMAR
jgi:hypothetical protein